MAGVCEDSVRRNFPDFSDPKGKPEQATVRDVWTQAQVDQRRDSPIDELLEEWDSLARQWESVLQQEQGESGIDASVLVAAPLDVGCHLHDIRHALGEPGDRDAPTTSIAFAISRSWLELRLDSAGLPAIRMQSPNREWVLGHRGVGVTVGGDRFELFRSITGRRSHDQLLALDWDNDPTPYLDTFSPYSLPEDIITE